MTGPAKRISLISAIPVFLMLAGSAATAAENSAPADAQSSKEEPDDRSYLPPWMQKPDAASTNSVTTADNGGAPAAANADQAQTKVQNQIQRPVRRSRSNDGFMGGFVSLFGR